MQEQITTQNEDGTWTIIASMVPSDGTPPSGEQLGLQLIEEEEVQDGEQVL